MARGPAVSALAAVLERRCPALPAAAEGAKLQTLRFQTMWRAAQFAVARQQVQHRVPWRLMANGDFEAVGHALSSSARFDEGRARRGSAARNGLAASKMALVSACAFACNARCEPACATNAF